MASLNQPHRRKNILTDEWVLVSPHRMDRPWQGQQEEPVSKMLLEHDPDCYLCPRNVRADGAVNPDFKATYVFDNDFPALLDSSKLRQPHLSTSGLLESEFTRGCCRVIVYSPKHNLSLAQLSLKDHCLVIAEWVSQTTELLDRYNFVQIFENRGSMMGCSNMHPHGQIWSHDHLPTELVKEVRCQYEYGRATGANLLLDYLEQEIRLKDRVVISNEHWVVVVPYWALWPFETLLIPCRALASLAEVSAEQVESLAAIQSELFKKYDRVFNVPFPLSWGWHSSPRSCESSFQLHAHFYPPLLRSATVKKFMVGYEMLAEAQRDLTPEAVALRLREA